MRKRQHSPRSGKLSRRQRNGRRFESLEARRLLAGLGVTATYYDNIDLTGDTVSKVSQTVDYDWGAGTPDEGISADGFSVRWEGEIDVLNEGTHVFQTRTEGGVRLWIDDQLVINNWNNHSLTTDTSAGIPLSAGQVVSVKMEYFEDSDGAFAQLLWQEPGVVGFNVIPESRLTPTLSRPAFIQWNTGHWSSQRASSVVANLDLATSRPFDGLLMSSYASDFLMDPTLEFVYDDPTDSDFDIRDGIANYGALQTDTFSGSTLQHNFARLNIIRPGDMYDDAAWDAVLVEIRAFARVAKEKGFEGIMIDNEEYRDQSEHLFEWDNVTDPTKTPEEYIAKSAERGRQLGDAIMSEFSDAELIAAHDPIEIAGPNVNFDVIGNNMRTAFTFGIWESTGPEATFHNGGEFGYQVEQWSGSGGVNYTGIGLGFDDTYRASRFEVPLSGHYARTDLEFFGTFPAQHYETLPASQSQAFADTSRQAFGTFDYKDWSTNISIRDATDTYNQNAWALARADDYVWYYTEAYEWLVPAGTQYPGDGGTAVAPPADVVEAIAAARETANLRQPGTVRSTNDFESGASNWSSSGGTWTTAVENGSTVYRQTNPNSFSVTSIDATDAPTDLGTLTDYTVTADVRLASDDLSGFGEVGSGVVTRFQDDNNFYGFHLFENGNSGKVWELFVREEGAFSVIASGAYDWSPGVWYTLQLEADGPNLTARVSTDGSNFTTLASEVDYRFSAGRFGLFNDGTAADYDNVTAIVDPIDIPASPISSQIGETGSLTWRQANSSTWLSQSFDQSYTNPVVVVGATSTNGGHAGNVRVRNVTSDGFEYQFDEWDYLDGAHTTETASWMVVEEGIHTLEDGRVIEAGTTVANQGWQNQSLNAFTETPVIFTQVSSANDLVGNDTVAVTTQVYGVNSTGFNFRLREQESNNQAHADETLSYIALGQGVITESGTQVARTGNSVTHTNFSFDFDDAVGGTPAFFAQMQTTDGGDTAVIRYRSLNGNGATIFVEEERSFNSEIAHTTEVVGWAAFTFGPLNSVTINPAAASTSSAIVTPLIAAMEEDSDSDNDELPADQAIGQLF